jgi:archaellin
MSPMTANSTAKPALSLRLAALKADQTGVTGLETAIILIAFVVVASVFAFTLLSTGIFSAERSKETVFAGLGEARSTLVPTGGMVGYGLTRDIISGGDTAWTAATSTVTSTVDTADRKRGVGSADIVVQTAATTGLMAYEDNVTGVNLTNQTQLKFWVKSSTSTSAGQIEVVLDENTGCGSPEAHVDIPALAANSWTLVTAAINEADGVTAVANANKDSVRCVGLEVESDLSSGGDVTINLDFILGAGQYTQLIFNVTVAVKGEPVNLTAPADSNADGLADDDAKNLMTVSYFDRNQLIRNLHWGLTYLGDNDGDNLLEQGERAEITIFLNGLADATPLTTDEIFQIELKPASGSVMVLKRVTPATVDLIQPLD